MRKPRQQCGEKRPHQTGQSSFGSHVECQNRRLVHSRGASPPSEVPERWRRVINVLCHDLSRRARPANILTVEREPMHSRCCRGAGITTTANTGRRAKAGATTAFICYGQASDQVRCRSRRGLPQPSAPRTRWLSSTCRLTVAVMRGTSILHRSFICTSVLASVYSGSGETRGEGSRGVGTRHAGDSSRL